MKKLMLLGGLRYLIPVIEAAHRLGLHVITVDYIPGNIAHKHSDEYHNVSIIDKDAVLALARELRIDGIMSFACDPGVVTAAYVQEHLGLPSAGPYESVRILQNKGLFRDFLKRHGFNAPKAKSYRDARAALADVGSFSFPAIAKPVDSAGSKGVTRVDCAEELPSAIDAAISNSFSGAFIIEEFIEKQGFSSDSDCFSIDGKLRFVSFNAQRFDENAAGPYVPAAFSWPSSMGREQEDELAAELQRLIALLGMRTSLYNVEARVGVDGKPYIMEVSPRGGGNRLAEMLRFAAGVDLIAAAVQAAVGDEPAGVEQRPYSGHWAEVILHAPKGGRFAGLHIDEAFRRAHVFQEDLWVEAGDEVSAFRDASCSLGTLVLKFSSEDEMLSALENQQSWLNVAVSPPSENSGSNIPHITGGGGTL